LADSIPGTLDASERKMKIHEVDSNAAHGHRKVSTVRPIMAKAESQGG
jgi:hypothetical protein